MFKAGDKVWFQPVVGTGYEVKVLHTWREWAYFEDKLKPGEDVPDKVRFYKDTGEVVRTNTHSLFGTVFVSKSAYIERCNALKLWNKFQREVMLKHTYNITYTSDTIKKAAEILGIKVEDEGFIS